jgi:hypothetical protein
MEESPGKYCTLLGNDVWGRLILERATIFFNSFERSGTEVWGFIPGLGTKLSPIVEFKGAAESV